MKILCYADRSSSCCCAGGFGGENVCDAVECVSSGRVNMGFMGDADSDICKKVSDGKHSLLSKNLLHRYSLVFHSARFFFFSDLVVVQSLLLLTCTEGGVGRL